MVRRSPGYLDTAQISVIISVEYFLNKIMSQSIRWVIALVLVIIGSWLLFQNQKRNRTTITPFRPNEQEETTTIIYTNQGYEPRDAHVKSGSTVKWINQSTQPMWTASDFHPTHLILPEFDNRAGISTGESYSFTFKKTGSWKYHNHLRPADRGTVVVDE